MVRSHHTRRSRRMPGGMLLLAVLAVLTGACNEQRHYRLLTFFFDGVPSPYEAAEGPDAIDPATGEPRRGVLAAIPTYYYHAAYTQRRCDGCHDPRVGYDTTPTGAETCQSCHPSHVEPVEHDWVHGAVVFGECRRCHEPHQSEHPGLLTTPQPQVCFTCHEPDYFKRDAYHGQLADLTCTRCHDPHAAGNRLLLADSRSYARRTNRTLASEHTSWTRDDCARCHQPERGNLVIDDVDAVCQSCHIDAMTAPAGQNLHEAVATGQCITCHDPHRSTRPALIRPTAEKICTDCHNPQELPRPQHPVVVRGDCLMCHRGHSSDRPSLLQPNIRLRVQAQPAARGDVATSLRPDVVTGAMP